MIVQITKMISLEPVDVDLRLGVVVVVGGVELTGFFVVTVGAQKGRRTEERASGIASDFLNQINQKYFENFLSGTQSTLSITDSKSKNRSAPL